MAEGQLPSDFGQSAMTHLAQPGHCLGPAKGFFDAFADALRDGVTGMASAAAVDRRTATIGILRDMRGDRFLSQLHDKVAGILALIGTTRDRLRAIGVGLDQRQGGQPLGMGRSARDHRADDQTVAVLHQRVTPPGPAPCVEAGVEVGGRGMRVIGAAFAAEIPRAVATRAERLARAIFGTEALRARPSCQQRAIHR